MANRQGGGAEFVIRLPLRAADLPGVGRSSDQRSMVVIDDEIQMPLIL